MSTTSVSLSICVGLFIVIFLCILANRPFQSRKGERFKDRKGFMDIKREPRERPDRMTQAKKRSRSRSPKRANSPRRRPRVLPRYVVQIPKLSFNL